jgi:hypothetical protein
MDGNDDHSLGCPMSKNPYAEVALTYLRRSFASVADSARSIFMLLLIGLSFMIPPVAGGGRLLLMLLPLVWLSSFSTLHVVEQFTSPQARLMPHFRRAHITVAAGIALAIGLFWPAMVSLCAGDPPVGLTALTTLLYGMAIWAQLVPSSGVLLAVILVLSIYPPLRDVVQQLACGQRELDAWGLLVLGVAAVVLGGIRLFRLSEDSPSYARLLQRAEAWQGRKENAGGPEIPWRWIAQQREASAVWHARQATASRWSRIRRWNAGVIPGRHVLVCILVVATSFVSNALAKRRVDPRELQQLLMLLPGIVAMIAMYHRPVGMATQFCLPVERRDYLKQLGAATALSFLRVWLVISAAALLLCMLSNPRPDFAEIGRLLAVSLLTLFWFFGVGVWFARFRSPTSIIPLSAIGLLLLLVILAGWCFVTMTDSQPFQLPTAVMAIVGVLLACDAYRRWLVTDLG